MLRNVSSLAPRATMNEPLACEILLRNMKATTVKLILTYWEEHFDLEGALDGDRKLKSVAIPAIPAIEISFQKHKLREFQGGMSCKGTSTEEMQNHCRRTPLGQGLLMGAQRRYSELLQMLITEVAKILQSQCSWLRHSIVVEFSLQSIGSRSYSRSRIWWNGIHWIRLISDYL